MFGPRHLPPDLTNQPRQRPAYDNDGQLLVQDIIIPTSFGGRFISFLSTQTLPNGRKTSLPVLLPHEFRKFSTPYSHWAPPPFNLTRNPSEAAAIRFMFTFSGLEELFDFEALLSGQTPGILNSIGQETLFNKSRFFDGFTLMPDRMWRANWYNRLVKLEKAMQHILLVIKSFEEIGKPEAQKRMRDIYNRGYDHLTHFDRALVSYYQVANEPRERPIPKTAELWAEYFFTHVTFVTERVHSWVEKKIQPFLDMVLDEISRFEEHSPEQTKLLDQLYLLNSTFWRADARIWVSLKGFKHQMEEWKYLTDPPERDDWRNYHGEVELTGFYPGEFDVRFKVLAERIKCLNRKAIWNLGLENFAQSGRRTGDDGVNGGFSPYDLARVQVREAAVARKELRGLRADERMVVVVEQEVWVSYLKEKLRPLPALSPDGLERPPAYTKWGWVAYRLYYGHSEEEWEDFVQQFSNDVESWGEGVGGIGDIKPKVARIKWIDGREVGIPEGDIKAAKRHLSTLKQTGGLEKDFFTVDAFLVADQSSIDSFIKFRRPPMFLPGQNLVDAADLRAFILVAEAEDEQAEQVRNAKGSSPGYDGTVRVSCWRVFDDVWASLFMRTCRLDDYWPIAARHPSFVYTGPIAHYQREGWKKMEKVKEDLIRKASAWKREGRLGS
ncbi:hypothetical protein QBC38DRAFT_148855 [Podospora fimiseda]|uniref:Uncharacterized protein n=1 Tax=Podospora fimiseda TaxID=252190 RepID=A0AAN7H446_9PEZI|nr:hypothetical protein QBC38DRAFT_148855 [Podospora fimiseda]